MMSPGLIYFITESFFYLLTTFTHLAHPQPLIPASGNDQYVLCISLVFVAIVFRFHIQVRSYSIYLSWSDLIHLTVCPQGPSMLFHMARFTFF